MDLEEGAGDVEVTRHLRRPWQEESVDQACDRAAFRRGGDYGVSQCLGAVASYLYHELVGVVTELVSVVEAVGEGNEGEIGGVGGSGHAPSRGDAGGECHVDAHIDESLGKLKRWVDVALCRKSY